MTPLEWVMNIWAVLAVLLTGCQYLAAGLILGSLAPRLDGRGHQVGCW